MTHNSEGHTPGPWGWTIHDHSCASLGVGSDPGMGTPLVMSVSPCRACADRAKDGKWEWGRCCTPSEADARLIAAAPTMLEALKKAKETIRAWHGPNAWEIYDRSSPEMQVINAAITLAKGHSDVR